MFLQVMVLWEVACLQKKCGSYFFECDEGEVIWVKKKKLLIEKNPVWCKLVLNIHENFATF